MMCIYQLATFSLPFYRYHLKGRRVMGQQNTLDLQSLSIAHEYLKTKCNFKKQFFRLNNRQYDWMFRWQSRRISSVSMALIHCILAKLFCHLPAIHAVTTKYKAYKSIQCVLQNKLYSVPFWAGLLTISCNHFKREMSTSVSAHSNMLSVVSPSLL